MSRLEGKVAMITVAARGQGRSHALRLADEGADIIAIDICKQIDSVPYPMATSDDLVTTVDLIKSRGRRSSAAEVDVRATQEDALEALTAMHALLIPFLDPIDVSNAVLYLASDDGRFITGTTHVIDAGALSPFKAPHLSGLPATDA